MPETGHIHRRHFLVGTAGVAGAAVALDTAAFGGTASAQEAGEWPAFVSFKDKDALTMHTESTFETKRAALGTGSITPNDKLYVRNNLPTPTDEEVGDRATWSIAFEGVNDPRDLTLADLKEMGMATVATVLQCSGNGRAFFDHETSGSQWTVGAVGNVLWTGVPVRTVVEALGGVADGMTYMTGTGGETLPQGLDENLVKVERSVPAEEMENAILAWEMNGAEMPLANGGPVRLVIPGYYGVNNIKYVKRLAFTSEVSPAKIMQTSYRIRPVGVGGAPDQPTMWKMNVKSIITAPVENADSGKVQISGVAFGGADALSKVEVTTDGGETWQEAELVGPDMGKFAWRPFVLKADLDAGTHKLASRATDAAGDSQPENFEPNERGYGNNGWRAHAVDVSIG